MDTKSAIYRFCNYQERSHQEVRDRLYQHGLFPGQVDQLIAELIESGLLNEERFAKAFVRGKFQLKHWGRIKIVYELKAHRVSEYLVKKALSEIDANEYFATALRLAERKWKTIGNEQNPLTNQKKLFQFLKQKGYETSIITEVIRSVADRDLQ